MTNLCSFGSNLFHQTNPDIQTSLKIEEPQLVSLDPNWESAKVLFTTDFQTVVCGCNVRGRSTGVEEEDFPIRIWGYDQDRHRIGHQTKSEEINVKDIKKWVGAEELVGYLDTKGIIHDLHDPSRFIRNSSEPDRKSLVYRDVSISGIGQVLVAIASEGHHSQIVYTLELWPSFESLMAGSSPGSDDRCHTFTLPDLDPTMTEVKLVSGADHFLILFHNREINDQEKYSSVVYGLGDNRFGQVGIGSHSPRVDLPQLLPGIDKVKSIDCGSFHSLVLTIDGTLYTFGHNRYGQCGHEGVGVDLSFPTLVDIGGGGENGEIVDVLDARCGSEHTVALTTEGVWVTGSNSLGQLGLHGKTSVQVFECNRAAGLAMGMGSDPRSWNIACGRWQTFVWDE